jgi:hypothetical protein
VRLERQNVQGAKEKKIISPEQQESRVKTRIFNEQKLHSGNQETAVRAGCWWLTPVVLATQEAEIRRITVESQPQASSS